MRPLLLLFLLAIGIHAAVSPIWSETPRVDTGNKILVNNHLTTTGTYTWSTSYHSNKTFSSNPWVGLCTHGFIIAIRKLMIASKNQEIGFHSYITGSPTMLSFIHQVDTYAPTEIWYLEVCYIAYDGTFQQFTDIKLTYKLYTDPDINVLDNSPGTFRTEDFNTGLTVTAGNDVRVVAFTTGFRGTLHNTYYQINVTEQIVGTDIQLKVTIHPDTVVQQISFYVISADVTALFTRCWIFTQTAVTKALNGIQFSFFVPAEVNYATNYISGLRSISVMENTNYNFTVSGLNFTTYSNSFYNDVTHFNLWVRICPSPYTLFNQVDFLCYAECPPGTYLQSADSICLPCFYTCATCTDSATCVTCGPNRVLDASGNCNCKDYYYEYNNVCVACHYSCLTCTHSGQYFNCMSCDTNMHRVLGAASNSTCSCTTGYIDYGRVLCDEICGDGKVYVDPCDDGNIIDGDGCSSACDRQTYFECDNPTSPAITPASICYFVGDITIKVVRIQKDPNANKATFFLKIEPFVAKFKDLSAANMVTNLQGAKYAGFAIDGELVKYTVTYPVDFQGSNMVFGIKPAGTGAFSRFDPKNATFDAYASNGLYLHAYSDDDYANAKSLGVAAMIMGYAFSAFAVFLCFGDWKQIGLQLFFSLQICFMSSIMQIYHHPYMTKMLEVRGVMGWSGELAQKIPPYHTVPVLEHMGYSVGFEYNFNIMVIFPGLALLLYLAYRGALYRHEKQRLEGKTTKQFEELLQGRILKHFKFQFFVYWMLFNMQQILMGTVIQAQYVENGGIYVFVVICLIGVVVCIIALFIRPGSTPAFRSKLFHKSYGNKTFLMVLIATLILDLLMLLTVLVNRSIMYATFAPPLLVGVYVIGIRPFRLMWNNIRLFIIQLCLIAVFALQAATYVTQFTVHKSFPMGILICMGIIMVVTLITWIYDIVKKICKLRRKDDYEGSSKYESQKEEESINEKVRQAGYALVHGNNASRLPPVYEMSNIPASGRKVGRSNLQPLKSPRSPMKSNMRQPINEKTNNKPLKSKLNPNTKQDDREAAIKKSREYEELRKREDTEERTDQPSTRRQRTNPYQQILNETANKMK